MTQKIFEYCLSAYKSVAAMMLPSGEVFNPGDFSHITGYRALSVNCYTVYALPSITQWRGPEIWGTTLYCYTTSTRFPHPISAILNRAHPSRWGLIAGSRTALRCTVKPWSRYCLRTECGALFFYVVLSIHLVYFHYASFPLPHFLFLH